MLGLGFFNSSFHKTWAFKTNIPTVMLNFLNPVLQGGWELLLDLPELGHFPLTPQYPTDPASTQFPPKHQRQEIWIQVPALPLTPWSWPTPAPSTSVFTCMMLHGVVTSCLSHGLQLLPGPRLPSILSSRPMAGPPGRTGEQGGWGGGRGGQ